MSGHSKWSTIKHKKAAADAKRGKVFTRIAKEVTIAARDGGGDPEFNPSLRLALNKAKEANMPKDNIERAIKRGTGELAGGELNEILYEGYGPHGVAMMVETATDNPTRTVANVRFAFKKEGGNLGSSGSVAFMFDEVGVFRLAPAGVDRDELELELIDDGLQSLEDGEDEKGEPLLILRCARDDFGSLQAGLDARGLEVSSSGIEWAPRSTTPLTEEQIDDVLKLVDRLEQDDDVQNVFTNLE